MPAPFRKSCNSCVSSKRRCDLALPRCYRCQVRSLDCSYPNTPLYASTPQENDLSSNSIQQPLTDPNHDNEHSSEIQQLYHASNPTELSTEFGENDFLPPFPDYDLDWPDVMGDIERFIVPDQIRLTDSPDNGVLAGEIFQGRVVYAVSRIKSYLDSFVSSGRTPFLHSKLYLEHLPVAIQDALGCCALYVKKNGTNRHLVFRTIRDKASHLVQEPMQAWSSPVEQLASVQALILYQIIRLFDGDIRLRADAEVADPILNRWTTQLKSRLEPAAATSLDDPTVMSASTEAASSPWRNWTFAESLRRTVIISFTLQGLYSFLKHGWDNSHHEFRDLSFHAQKALWHATSEYTWILALKEHSSLPVSFNNWDADIGDAAPSDLEELGVMMMALLKGVDECSRWIGPQELETFGLQLNEGTI